MLSISRLTAFLALGASAVSAIAMVPALPNALGKRVVQCGGGYFCEDNHYCMTGTNGLPACCPDGEVCTGPGGIKTIITTTLFTIDTTLITTHYFTTTGVNTETEVTTITTTEEPVYTTTVTTYTTDVTITPSVVTDYFTYTTFTTETVPTTPCSSSTVKTNVTATYTPRVNISATATPPPSEGGAAGSVVNAGLAGVVLAVLAVMMV